jgi:hypothetical protein
MEILSHRGYWKTQSEKNTMVSFERSFSLGFGTETDLRDLNGNLVISHDIPSLEMKDLITAEEFFKLYKSIGNNLPLALNIKSDGLQEKLLYLINKYEIENYFVFDMSVPDTIGYFKKGLKVFTRQSEYEEHPAFLTESEGVWMDEFNSHWITQAAINIHIKNDKKVCIVSPELHKREKITEWVNYKGVSELIPINKLMLCTDLPEEAKEYFNL